MRRFGLILAVCGAIAAFAPATGAADPPQPPPGCAVVVTTPAATTGSDQGQAKKEETFDRLCLP
jgi:ABC-type glycerol-3-phosphate transport system substrate-binding protein